MQVTHTYIYIEILKKDIKKVYIMYTKDNVYKINKYWTDHRYLLILSS